MRIWAAAVMDSITPWWHPERCPHATGLVLVGPLHERPGLPHARELNVGISHTHCVFPQHSSRKLTWAALCLGVFNALYVYAAQALCHSRRSALAACLCGSTGYQNITLANNAMAAGHTLVLTCSLPSLSNVACMLMQLQ